MQLSTQFMLSSRISWLHSVSSWHDCRINVSSRSPRWCRLFNADADLPSTNLGSIKIIVAIRSTLTRNTIQESEEGPVRVALLEAFVAMLNQNIQHRVFKGQIVIRNEVLVIQYTQSALSTSNSRVPCIANQGVCNNPKSGILDTVVPAMTYTDIPDD